MIIRRVTQRQGRRALSSALSRTCVRCASTEATNIPSTLQPSQAATPTQTQSPSELARSPRVSIPPQWNKKQSTGPDTTVADFIARTKLARKTAKLGSAPLRPVYDPSDLIRNPPAPKDISLELLMANQTHMGHNTGLWNPANSKYIYGVRQGIHIISLEQTAAHLRRAARVVEEVAYRGGLILFVGTRPGQMDLVVKAANLAGACHLFTKWAPGTITNRDQMLRDGELKIVDEKDRTLEGFDQHLMERRPLLPDLVVVMNPLENFTLLHECAFEGVPTIGVIDTDADPTRVTYAIPANDDSLRSVAVIAGVLGRAGELGQKKRLHAAQKGQVTWQNPHDVSHFIELDTARRLEESLAEEHQKDSAAAREEENNSGAITTSA